MNCTGLRSIALVSVFALALPAATRPRYGGVLRINVPTLPVIEESPLVAETLVRIDDRGEFQPGLARSWQRDADGRRWRFFLRTKVLMHDGTPLTAAVAASALGMGASAAAQHVILPAEGDILERVATAPVVKRLPDGAIVGTGPFRLAKVEPGRRATLTAFDEHWAGRPFLDSVEYSSQRGSPADVVALPVSVTRRAIPERMRLWTSRPLELIAVTAPANLRELIAAAIDRESIAAVITQRRGEPARGLLPEWLTGYASALPGERDMERARQAGAAAKPGTLIIEAPAGDPLLRIIADRVALNVRDAGVDARAGSPGSVRVVRVRIASSSVSHALAGAGRALNLVVPPSPTLQAAFEVERSLVTGATVVPIVHIPELYALDPRVRDWNPARVENVWIAP
jgi:peptide/nickel transport system substrate-binding protein